MKAAFMWTLSATSTDYPFGNPLDSIVWQPAW
jgi:hypothetical protein